MRKLLLVLLGFIAVFTYIQNLEKPEAAEFKDAPQEARIELLFDN